MNTPRKTIVIAGTREAHSLVAGLVAQGRDVVATSPEADHSAPALPVPVTVRRFADAPSFAAWIAAHNPAAVIDAGHPFEDGMSHAAAAFCKDHGLKFLRLLRAPWHADPLDKWIDAGSVAAASSQVPPGAAALSNTGRRTQQDYAAYMGRILYLRRLSDTSERPPFAFMQYLVGPAPFTVDEEAKLFQDLQLDYLITRNVGGDASASKLIAARQLGLPVIMIHRPAPPDAPLVETVAEALAWERAA